MIVQAMRKGLSRKALAIQYPVVGIGKPQLEHVFCQIDSNSRSIHGGLLS
jgi:hypothetical protein